MEILKDLRPAEAYFLMTWMTLDTKLLGYTLGSLVMEKCFEVRYVKKQVHPRVNKFSTYKMIRPSVNFDKMELRSYEKPILELMGNDRKKEIQLRTFMKAVGSTYWKDKKSFRDDYLGRSPHLHGYYQDNFLLKWFDRRTAKGKALGQQLSRFFESKDRELKKHQEEKNDQAILELLSGLGVHAILLKNLNDNIMKDLRERYKNSDYLDDAGFAFAGGGFSDFSDTYSSFGGFDGGDFGGGGAGGSWGDSGGGDSGCSSCSGCGGCGGCGGCS
ncbi:MAG: hypothetical protein KDD41_02505 [Flavobacteriales bacterium]|nr:hypothetical protein [Flavobacteriales bacterium]